MSADTDAIKRIRFWVSLGSAFALAVAVATWTVASKVYAMENRVSLMEASHEFMVRQLNWLTKTMWDGRPTTPPPERKVQQ